MSATVSVLMPLHKAKPEYLRAALDCVFAQTFQDWKIVLVNDPVDRSIKDAIPAYLKDPRVTFVQGERPRSIGQNWNECLPYADTPFIQYLFYDDLWEPDYLEKMLKPFAEHPSVGFVSGNHTYLMEGESPVAGIYKEVEEFKKANVASGFHKGKELLYWWAEKGLRPNIIGEPSFVMMRKELLAKTGGFHETMRQYLDSEFWTRCLLAADWYDLPDMVGKFRVHAAGTSAQNESMGKGVFERFDTFKLLLERAPEEDKPRVRKALQKTFEAMIGRYFERRKEGRVMTADGSGELKKFCLQHPLIILRAILGYLMRGRTQA